MKIVLLGADHGVAATVCLYRIISVQFPFEEGLIYAIGSILFGMGVHQLIKRLPLIVYPIIKINPISNYIILCFCFITVKLDNGY